MSRQTQIIILTALLAVGAVAQAAVPERMSYQGRLTDNGGNPLSGNFDLTFRIYADSVGGGPVYEETQAGITVTDGLFSVLIGGLSFITPFDDYVFIGQNRFLGIQVNADPELTPRTRLSTSPYAFRVSTVDSATGGAIVGDLKVTGKASTGGDVGVGTEFPSAGAAASVSRVLEIEAPSAGAGSGAALSLTDGSIGNTWDMIARSSDGVLGFYANGNGLIYMEDNGDFGLGTPSPSTGVVGLASRVLEINAPFAAPNTSGAALTLVDGNFGYAWDIVATSSSGNLGVFANGQGRIYVEANGDVGLGSSSPSTGAVGVASRVLEIQAPFAAPNSSGAALTLTDGNFGSAWDIVATSLTGGLGIYGNNNQVMFMQPGGNVGIGTSSPSVELEVSGDICYTGSIGACSDARFKTDVHPLVNSLGKVTQLRGVTYRWKQADFPDRKFDGREHLGFIAQEVEGIFPEMVLTDDAGYKSVDYARLTPVLVEAVKAQQKQIDRQQREIDELKTLVQQLVQATSPTAEKEYGMK